MDIEKPKRTKIKKEDRISPSNIEQLVQRYDLDNEKIYDYLDYLVNELNERLGS